MLQNSTLYKAFEYVASRSPDSSALRTESHTWSYRDLRRASLVVAEKLTAEGVRPGDRVAISYPRGVEWIVAILGILACRCAYVPFDPNTPSERKRVAIGDSGALELSFLASLDADEIRCSRHPKSSFEPPLDASSTDLAYIIYTSGSTGVPKGVPVTNFAVMELFRATREIYRFSHEDVWPLFHACSFDVSVWEMWGALLSGSTLRIMSQDDVVDPEKYGYLVQHERLSILNFVPSAFEPVLSVFGEWGSIPDWVKYIIFAGEPIRPRSVELALELVRDGQCRVANMYGTTETTIHASHAWLTNGVGIPGATPIGRALSHLSFQLLDAPGAEFSQSGRGELCISGSGVMQGYINRPELNDERLVRVGQEGAIWYRTGDFVSKHEGEYIHHGRIDRQVKISGFRIELGDIEAAYSAASLVDRLVAEVIRTPSGRDVIVGFYVSGTEIPGPHLRAYGLRVLPSYMVPHRFLRVNSFPITANGKLDSRSLSRLALKAYSWG